MTELDQPEQREQAAVALLRQLWLGLSAYRLYPGSLERPGFVAAAERIRATSERVLAGGSFDVEVHGQRFHLDGQPLPEDQTIERLALACFERRAERLVVQAVPETTDLDALFRVLSAPVADLEAVGGADAVLSEAGISSVTLGRVGPDPVVGADHVPETLAQEPSSLVEGLSDPASISADLLLEDLSGSPADQAETILGRFRSIIGDPATGYPRDVDFYGRVHEVITDLPAELRRSLTEIMVDHVRDDPLAERLIGTMSNAELTRALVDLGREGARDPVQLARQLASAGVRHLDIVDLTTALEAGREEAGTILSGLEQLGIDLEDTTKRPEPGGSVSDVLGQYLLATEREDLNSIEGLVPAGEEQRRVAAFAALHDYLGLEADLERVGEVLDLWVSEVREAIQAHDTRGVERLLGALRDAYAGDGDHERASLFEAYRRQVLAGPFLTELIAAEAEAETSPLPTLLAPFGAVAVNALFDLLADEEVRSRRALLLGALRQVAPGHLGPVVERLSDPRWYVVRNAVNVLRSVGGEDFLGLLEDAAHHSAKEVRREATYGLVSAGGVKAIPHLQRLASGPESETRELAVAALGGISAPEVVEALAEIVRTARDPVVWHRALDELGNYPSPEAADALQSFGSRRTRPKVPRAVRRYAKARAKQRRSGGP